VKIFLAVIAVVTSLAGATAASAQEGDATFGTPGDAVYCNSSGSYLGCWTPNDGFSVWMTSYGRVHKSYSKANRDFIPYTTRYDLRFGRRWRDGHGRFVCNSRSSGLTCQNARGHGWWLGRYVGYRVF
jgi:hypothetical protein